MIFMKVHKLIMVLIFIQLSSRKERYLRLSKNTCPLSICSFSGKPVLRTANRRCESELVAVCKQRNRAASNRTSLVFPPRRTYSYFVFARCLELQKSPVAPRVNNFTCLHRLRIARGGAAIPPRFPDDIPCVIIATYLRVDWGRIYIRFLGKTNRTSVLTDLVGIRAR